MKELIVSAVALGYTPLFYTKRGTINAMAKKLEGITVERCKPLELSHLQRWLREEKDCHITVQYCTDPCYIYNIDIDGKSKYFSDISKEDFKTHEEALEEGLKEAVNLVEN